MILQKWLNESDSNKVCFFHLINRSERNNAKYQELLCSTDDCQDNGNSQDKYTPLPRLLL